jgi:hypothetical protein
LALNAERKLRLVMASSKKRPMVPSICIDNLDMEQKVHDLSVGNQSHTFRGTWGYIHIPNKDFMKTLDSSQLTMSAYQESIRGLESLVIKPAMLLPTAKENKTSVAVWKSQIA